VAQEEIAMRYIFWNQSSKEKSKAKQHAVLKEAGLCLLSLAVGFAVWLLLSL